MNCNNCGAPLRAIDGRDHFECGFCHTFHFPSALEDSLDRLTPLGGDADEKCPTCHIALSHGALDGTRVLYCETCRGLLVGSEAFAFVVRQRRANFQGADDQPTPLNQEELKRQTACPKCQGKMETHAYYGPGNAVIDSCHRCKLIWADHGEVAVIERAPGRR